MTMLVVKTGAEKYGNRVYTSDFFLPPINKGDDMIKITEHHSYIPHEQIICGQNGCFGTWEIGHVNLPEGTKIFARFTRKYLVHDIHNENRQKHVMISCTFEVGSDRDRRYTLNYWGYNAGEEISVMLQGRYNLVKQEKGEFKLNTPFSKIPF